jgi:predicted membrane metal-binding protein
MGLSFLLLAAVYPYLGIRSFKKKSIGLFIGVSFSLNSLATLSKALHTSLSLILSISIPLVLVIYVMLIFRKIPRMFLLRPFTLFFLAINILLFSGLQRKLLTGYKYYTASVNEINFLIDTEDKAGYFLNYSGDYTLFADIQKESITDFNRQIDQFIARLGKKLRKHENMGASIVSDYIGAAVSISEYGKDNTDLETALGMVRAANRVNEIYSFNNPYINRTGLAEADILNKLGRKEDAIAWLIKIKAITSDPDFKKDIEKKTDEIVSGALSK